MITAEMTHLGFGMDGMGSAVAEVVQDVCNRFDQVTYIEIGVGHGATLTSIASVISDSKEDWRAIGLELPNGYSFNQKATKANGLNLGFKIEFVYSLGNIKLSPAWTTITVVLENAQTFLAEHWAEQIQFALIDGCHGKKCATLEF